MPKPISLQLYTLRDQMKDGAHMPVLEAVAETGYVAVEPAGFYGMTAQKFGEAIRSLGLEISSNHSFPIPDADSVAKVIDDHHALGVDLLVSGFGPDDFANHDAIARTAEKTNKALELLEGSGLELCLHNHWWEYEMLDGKLKIEHFIQRCPDVKFQIDTYWAANFGANDPAKIVERFKSKAPTLHIKDGPLVQGQPHVACGKGKMDIPAVLAAADPNVLRWGVVELDQCSTDMLQAVKDSYRYLVGEGLLAGRK